MKKSDVKTLIQDVNKEADRLLLKHVVVERSLAKRVLTLVCLFSGGFVAGSLIVAMIHPLLP
jgi:hypothetical protein